ncbi:hypothetical protein OAU50_07380 [Planctomycetota bacterium]|nr:hypothetical protein [Planctomycetota bacterium]
MFQNRFLGWNVLFLAVSAIAALVALFPDVLGPVDQTPEMPERVSRNRDLTTERLSDRSREHVRIERPLIRQNDQEIDPTQSVYADAHDANRKAELASAVEVVRERSPRMKELARQYKNRNLFETDPIEPAPPKPVRVIAVADDPARVQKEAPPVFSLDAALKYYKDFQHDDGHWSATTHWAEAREGAFSFDKETQCDTEYGWEEDEVANTSLALLCFLSAGNDPRYGDFKSQVRSGVIYLRKLQTHDGRFSDNPRHHALAVTAMSECYGLSGMAVLKPTATQGVKALIKMQNEDSGFGESGLSNVVDTGYAVVALKTASVAGIEFDKTVFEKAHKYVESMRTENRVRYSTSYRLPPQEGNNVATEFPLCEVIWLYTGLTSEKIRFDGKSAKLVSALVVKEENLPKWESGNIDCRYYWFAGKVMFQLGGDGWELWKEAIVDSIAGKQRGYTELDADNDWKTASTLLEHGSWDPAGINGPRYGRVFTTAMCFLAIEECTCYRYMRVADPVEVDPSKDPIIVEDPNDEINEDTTNQPSEDLAENENTDATGPVPSKN